MNNSLFAPSSRRHTGFTLVELMVVVLIISILAAIAYPGYRSHVVKTQRGAAKACLMQYSAFMERYYTTNLRYTDAAPGNLDCALEGNMPQNYTFTVPTRTATTYVLRATPTDAFEERDTQCGALTLDQAGEKDVTSGDASDCW